MIPYFAYIYKALHIRRQPRLIPLFKGGWSPTVNTTQPTTNIRGDWLNKLFGNCIKEKQSQTKPENAINSTYPGVSDDTARPHLFQDYEYDSSVFTPQSGNSAPSTNPDSITSNPWVDIMDPGVSGINPAPVTLDVPEPPSTGGCCPDFGFTPQSGAVEALKMDVAPSQHKEANVTFRDQINNYMVDIGSGADSIHTKRDTDDASLDRFFERPLKIASFDWGVTTTLFQQFNPWELYFDNPRVSNRIANFKLLRCKLHVKFLINGNGFQYGRVMASYLPLPLDNPMRITSSLISQDRIIESQRPHVFLDPTTSTGGEMLLPFFWPKSYLDIPTAEWGEMGEITLASLNTLRHANGAADFSTISVFAWAEDVQLSGLTQAEPNSISPQSGSEIDQANMNGVISHPASNVAKIAGALTNAPYIGKYAKATQLGASTIARVASSFGYSKPPMTVAPTPMKPLVVSSLATVTTPDTSHKLTMDDKQELCIDPNTVGLSSVDEMAITEIAKRESYLTTFEWPMGTVKETLLWNCNVTPMLYGSITGPPTLVNFTAMAWAALPFQYWTGSLKFRFQIVCSTFHKGRIKITYDPTNNSGSEYNTMYTEIVDIADAQDFTVTISNNQSLDLLTYRDPCGISSSVLYGDVAIATPQMGNGIVSVYVVNELTTPNSDFQADIQVNVFVSAGDDFEVYAPWDKLAYFRPQSGSELVPESQETEQPSAPFQTSYDHLGMLGDADNALALVYGGESIKSFRQLAKRFALWRATPHNVNGINNTYVSTITHPAYPFHRNDDLAADGGLGRAICNTLPLHWVRLPFAGWRGSIRYKVFGQNFILTRSATFLAERYESPFTAFTRDIAAATASADPLTVARNAVKGVTDSVYGHAGACVASSVNTSALEYEVPYQVNYRFNGNLSKDTPLGDVQQGGARCRISAQGDATSKIDIWVAGGEDFSTFFWVGPPRMICESTGPSSGA